MSGEPPWTRAGPGGPWGRRGGPWGRRGRPRHGAGIVGCFVAAIVLLAATIAVLTWIAGVLLGVVAPEGSPSFRTAVAMLVVLVLAVLVFGRSFGTAVRPLAEIASATERLADGEPSVRVAVRGPRAVRGLAASFNVMAERLDRSRQERQALLADVTHELRTPLTVIGGGIEAMLDGVHPRDDEHLAPILAETRVMERLLDDLRTLSLADAGALPLHREPVELVALAREVAGSHAAAAEHDGVSMTVADGPPVATEVDPVRIRQVLANLVANALRHTPRGGSVSIAVGTEGEDAVLTVADTGEGIAPADLERVFDRFQRRADTGGSGLGLTIARDLVTAHGGTIEARSDGVPGHGTTFTIRLPPRG